MGENFLKRSYYLPPQLCSEWEKFHSPSKNYSPSMAGGMLLYMVVEPKVRELLRKLACSEDIEAAKIEAHKELREAIVDAYLAGFVGNLSEADRKLLLRDAIRSEKKLSRKK